MKVGGGGGCLSLMDAPMKKELYYYIPGGRLDDVCSILNVAWWREGGVGVGGVGEEGEDSPSADKNRRRWQRRTKSLEPRHVNGHPATHFDFFIFGPPALHLAGAGVLLNRVPTKETSESGCAEGNIRRREELQPGEERKTSPRPDHSLQHRALPALLLLGALYVSTQKSSNLTHFNASNQQKVISFNISVES